ncbi:DUF4400 domain-containing protein [Halomonas sp. I5-271120]|uniref:DUF4400 domain-containing protein n=1 Tax=Halomonas sp. I5-271120 TaxID=3061632 RepID=UPI002714FDD5|nr:DUF4400 domain-containing protein [Halomonas sp. I5-271120]
MQKPLFLILILLVFEIFMIILVVPTDWMEDVIRKEQMMGRAFLGESTQLALTSDAERMFNSLMMDTGVYQAVHQFFIPTEEERLASGAMKDLGRSEVFPYAESRVQALAMIVFQVMIRISEIMLWMPYLLVLAVPAIYDGYCQWHINRSSYQYSSPLMHRYGMRGMGLVLLASLMISIVPLPIPPVVVPVAGFCMIAFLGITIKNIQKRI